MKGYTPAEGLPAHQSSPVAELFRHFALGFERIDLGRKIDEHVAALEPACRDDEDYWRLAEELDEMTRWFRGPAYCLTFTFQTLTQRRRHRAHVVASLLFADAQIGLAEDRSLNSTEVAWHTLRKLIEADPSIEPALAGVRDDVVRRLRLHHRFYATWSRPFGYLTCNPLAEHLYNQRVFASLSGAYPDFTARLRTGVPWEERLVALREIAAEAQAREDAYHWLVARRFAAVDAGATGELERAAAELQKLASDVRALNLEAEIGHVLRQRAWVLAHIGELREAAAELERAMQEEQPVDMLGYWYALTARELGDVRMRKAPEHPSGPAVALDGALKAYGGGRRLFDVVLAGGGPPAATTIKRQMLRSYNDNALGVALALDRPLDALAEVEASGPRGLGDTLAEIRATAALPGDDAEEFLQTRAVFERHLTSVPESFEQYLAELPAQYAARYRYEAVRSELRVLGGRHGDEVAQRLLARRGDDRLVLAFFLGPSISSRALLLDLADASLEHVLLLATEQPLRDAHAAYAQALAAAAALPDPAPAARRALDAHLDAVATVLAPALELLATKAAGRRLIVVPQMQLGAVPFGALPVGGGPLIDLVTDLAFAPSLGLLADLLEAPALDEGTPSPGVTVIHDTSGTPFFAGTIHALAGRRTVRSLDDPSTVEALEAIGTSAGEDTLFACHGVFDPEHPAASALRIGAGEGLSLSELSGELALPRCRCVVLGACESGLARSEILSEHIGLAGVLLSAGVRNVVASLWEINQLGTAVLLADCLAALGDGADVPAALTAAQRSLRAMTRDQLEGWIGINLPGLLAAVRPIIDAMPPAPFAHPADWAGFVASGPGPPRAAGGRFTSA